MTYYRLCHFDELHTLNAAEHFLAPDDNRALEIANERKCSSGKWEVWAIGRFVGETTGEDEVGLGSPRADPV